MARVLLVNPPFYRIQGSHFNGMSLGLAYIAAMLNRQGHEAAIYNGDFAPSQDYITLYDVYRGFSDYIRAFRDPGFPMYHEAADVIAAYDPEWVGYTCYTANVPVVEILAQMVRARLPGVRQVAGGVHPTVCNTRPIAGIEHLVAGEGEHPMARLVGRVTNSPLVSWPSIEDLDSLPPPDRENLWVSPGRAPAPWERARCFSLSAWAEAPSALAGRARGTHPCSPAGMPRWKGR